jgi:subtilisin family serine protease
MKKLIVILWVSLIVICVNGQDFYMYVNGTKHFYGTSATKMLIQSEIIDTVSMKNAIQGSITGQIQRIYQLSNKLVMIDMQNVSRTAILNIQKQWNNKENVIYTSPVLLDSAGVEIGGITNKALIRLKSVQDYLLLVNSIATYSIQSVKLCDFDERTYLLTVDKSSNKDAMQIANELYETGMFEYAEPNLIHFIKFETNDTYFPEQWALNNTGQYGGTAGTDIKANQAWTVTAGSPDVRIAILDIGVDLTHPDLQANLLTGFDATGGSGNGAAVNNLPHGTACAGIAAAAGNNNEGIAGVAYGCHILPVRIATTNSGWTSTESQYIASGIDWARTNGASVISMSFTCVETDVLNTAISSAVTSGRSNDGCVLIASSGNNNSSIVGYPARNTNVIAVGAISPCGERKSTTSCDGETWWGSNYGTNLDVVAPGVDIYTTDIQGNAGYNTTSGTAGNYYASFNGTSAACPHVAGIAALILSVRPDLTQVQVRQAIESTCTKLSGYSFSTNSNHPNGTWNSEVGHGLVNAYAALGSIAPVISGPSTVCSGNATFTVNNAPSSYTWGYSSSLTLVSTSGNTATFSKSGSGGENVSVRIISGGITVATKNFLMGGSPYIEDTELNNKLVSTGCENGYRYGLVVNSSSWSSLMGVNQFEWRSTSSSFTFEPYPVTGYVNVPGDKVRITSVSGNSGSIEIRAHNACGWSGWVWAAAITSSCSSYYSMSASPNPVSSTLDISITSNEDASQSQSNQSQISSAKGSAVSVPEYEIKLFTNTGSLVRQTTVQNAGNISMNVSDLPAGLYILHVHDGSGNPPQTRNIIVSH